MVFWKLPLKFFAGGAAYVGMEVVFRGRSHGSMFWAGGTSFLLLGSLRRQPAPVRGLVGAMMITAVELVTGLAVNRDHQIWDYRQLPLNFRGQICLPFSLLWIPVSLWATALYPQPKKIRGAS